MKKIKGALDVPQCTIISVPHSQHYKTSTMPPPPHPVSQPCRDSVHIKWKQNNHDLKISSNNVVRNYSRAVELK